ncbi:MAG: hypothetical protein FWG63_10805 [Defluviitaleaceae bacterium]|nr:hypothetical protein [Defluviitaleaceae bacterium]
MEVLAFLFGIASILEIILAVTGVVLYILGHKLIRVVYLLLGVTFGFVLGFLIGFVIQSTLLSYINGITLAIVFGFFNFFHYQYLKGVSLGILSLGLCIYLALIASAVISFPIIIAVSGVVSMVLAIANYKYERVITIFITTWLGALLLVHNNFGIVIDVPSSWLTVVISFFVGIIGFCFQYFVVSRIFPKQV